MSEHLIIDRFEGEWAVCERPDGSMTQLERALLPPEAREGDLLLVGEGRTITLDPDATAARRRRTADRLRRLRGC